MMEYYFSKIAFIRSSIKQHNNTGLFVKLFQKFQNSYSI